MLQWLLGDAADSPIVSQRGSELQLSGGIGAAYVW
jgi:outer membrane scaffolding protein for murein synthesis (MipA/OmpV family)